MLFCDKIKSSRYLWSTLGVVLIAACAVFFYFSLFSGKSIFIVSSVQTSKDSISPPEKLTAEECSTICDSEACVFLSNDLHDYINPKADPCENFFQFACGNMFEIYDPTVYFSVSERHSDEVNAKLKVLLDNIQADPNSSSGKMKIVYDSCMKYGASEIPAVPTILEFLSNVGIRDWPHLPQDFKFTDMSFLDVIANFIAHREFGFIQFSTDIAFADPDLDFSLKVNATLSKEQSPYEKLKEPERKYLVDKILIYFKVNPETINEIWEESQTIQEAIISLQEESGRIEVHSEEPDPLYCSGEAVDEWTDACQVLESLIAITNSHEKVNTNFVKPHAEYFMKTIFPLLRNFTDRSVANYLALNLFINNINELSFYFRRAQDNLTSDFEYQVKSKSKWKTCSRWISSYMTSAVGYEYLRKTKFTVESLHEVGDLAEECIRESANLVSHQQWMSEEEKRNIQEEIFRTGLNINDTIEILTNESRINKFYERFYPTSKNYFLNVLHYKKFLKTMEFNGFYTEEDDYFFKRIFLTNAFGGGNNINIFLGYLVPPTYTPGIQRFMNLLSLGFIFVHELGHNLESFFNRYINTTGYYNDKVKCIADQYSQFTLETIGKNLDGSQYHKETFADTIAISVMDKIVEKYSLNSSSLLPSLSYTLQQQMYIHSLNMFCTIHTKKRDEIIHKYGSHPPKRIRINGMMQNSKLFSRVFGCKEGSFMNPSTKCAILQ